MIRYTIKNRRIEIEYDTGKELKYISLLLGVINMFNEVRKWIKNKLKLLRNSIWILQL